MPIVLVQQDEATTLLTEGWRSDPQTPEEEMKEEGAWTNVCTALVKKAVEENDRTHWNTFLLFSSEEFPAKRHGANLSELIDRARNRTWGSRLFLGLSEAPSINHLDHSTKEAMTKWMGRLLEGRVNDLIEIGELPDLSDRKLLNELLLDLRDRASSVDKRQEIFRKVSGHNCWRAALPPNWRPTAAFLGRTLATTQPDGDLSVDLLVVLRSYSDDPDVQEAEQEAEIERHLSKDGESRQRLCRVVTYRHSPSVELQQYCAKRKLGMPVAIGGGFELWYLLLRLNAHAVPEPLDHLDSIHAVLLDEEEPKDPPTSVLLTSAFGLSENKQWLEAATDVGELLKHSPVGIEYRVELGVDPDRLLKIQDNNSHVNVWIHMGHGDAKEGLWVANGFIPDEKWMECIDPQKLLLALFLTCNSHVIAWKFAAHGAGVAIGIEGKVESNRARELGIGVVNAMLAGGSKPGAILSGFKAGQARMKSVQLLEAKARAYYPRRV